MPHAEDSRCGGLRIADVFGLLYRDTGFSDLQTEIRNVVPTPSGVGHEAINNQFKQEIMALARNVTLHCSSNDRPLLASRLCNRGPGLGESAPNPSDPGPSTRDRALSGADAGSAQWQMKRAIGRMIRLLTCAAIALVLAVLLFCVQGCSSGPVLKRWHTVVLSEEFSAEMEDGRVRSFGDYLALEQRLFRQLDEQVYAKTATGPAHALERYSAGSEADPNRRQPNWNRSFEHRADAPAGGALLLHGMSDSPYTFRTLGETLSQRGYWVVGLRLPGHGTAPSGLKRVTWRDMAASVRLAMEHLASKLGSKPLHIIGYSTGAPLALDFTLDALEEGGAPVPASLVLISPAIRVHPAGALAGFKNALASVPGLGSLAYLMVMDEFDPYKYNSFATNAGAQVHRITRSVDRRIQALAQNSAAVDKVPPILVFKSTVDSTVTTEAVVDTLLMRLPAGRNEMVLFDINRNTAIKSTLMVSDPGPLTDRLMADSGLPFAVTFVTNENPYSAAIVARHQAPFSVETSDSESLGLAWPRGVVSLSHVALPFPPDDPLYGQRPPKDGDLLFLGDMAIKGERGLLRIPANWLLRLRHNPFYTYLERRALDWLDHAKDQITAPGRDGVD